MKRSMKSWAPLVVALGIAAGPADGATFFVSDVTQWVGPDAGPGIAEAVLVVQWPGEPDAWAWGYRWPAAEPRTGGDLLAAMAAASGGLFEVIGLDFGFIMDLRWQGRSFPGFDPGSGRYLQYFVNNPQQPGNYNDGAAPAGAHILPPLGSPYDGDGPGEWVASNTGVLGRPLVDGAWDGWVYAAFGEPGPAQAVNAPAPIPEPQTFTTLAGGILAALAARRRRSRPEPGRGPRA
jgi:hypothetical protein